MKNALAVYSLFSSPLYFLPMGLSVTNPGAAAPGEEDEF